MILAMKNKEIKFETLKKKAKDAACAKMSGAESVMMMLSTHKHWRANIVDMRQSACEVIDKWDIREVGKLIDIFPFIIPPSYHNKKITIYMADNENCDWMIKFD